MRQLAPLLILFFATPGWAEDLSKPHRLFASRKLEDHSAAIGLLVDIDNTAAIEMLLDRLRREHKILRKVRRSFEKATVPYLREMGILMDMLDERIRRLGEDRERELKRRSKSKFNHKRDKQTKKVNETTDRYLRAMAVWSPVVSRVSLYETGLGRFKSDAAIAALAHAAETSKANEFRCACIQALGQSGRPGAKAVLRAAVPDDDPRVRAAAVRAMRSYVVDAAVVAEVVAQLADECWQVRRGAVDALAAAPAKLAIPALIAASQNQTGDLQRVIELHLYQHTGVTFHDEAANWKDWWKQNQAAVKGGSFEKEAGEAPKWEPVFLDLPLTSHNVLFVIGTPRDHTASMAAIQKELPKAIEALSDGARFNIAQDVTTPLWFSENAVIADKRTKSKALKWIAGLRARGRTGDFVDRFQIEIDDAKGKKLFSELFDTIYLLGTTDKKETPKQSASLFQEWNARSNVMIHASILGRGKFNGDLAKLLVKATGGWFASE